MPWKDRQSAPPNVIILKYRRDEIVILVESIAERARKKKEKRKVFISSEHKANVTTRQRKEHASDERESKYHILAQPHSLSRYLLQLGGQQGQLPS